MVSVIIAAAGSGSRMNNKKKKQFITLLDVPILVRTLRQFDLKEVDEIVVVTNEADLQEVHELIMGYGLKVDKVVCGGHTRQASIYNGLLEATGEDVLIHDAARPFITKAIILEHIEKCSEIGLITAVPCKDTIKIMTQDKVEKTLDRSKLVNVQTPQSFKREMLIKAYDFINNNNISVTDDASVYEANNLPVKMVMGSYENIKITTPEDLWMGEMIIKRSSK